MNNKNPAIETNEEYKKEILKSFDNKPKEIEQKQYTNEFTNKWNMNNKIINLFENNIEQDQKMRNKYAIILMVILVLELVGLLIIFVLKGAGKLNYSDATFNLFITGGIAEVFVLVNIIVRYLFKDNLTETLKIIITSNNNRKVYKSKHNRNNKKTDKP